MWLSARLVWLSGEEVKLSVSLCKPRQVLFRNNAARREEEKLLGEAAVFGHVLQELLFCDAECEHMRGGDTNSKMQIGI